MYIIPRALDFNLFVHLWQHNINKIYSSITSIYQLLSSPSNINLKPDLVVLALFDLPTLIIEDSTPPPPTTKIPLQCDATACRCLQISFTNLYSLGSTMPCLPKGFFIPSCICLALMHVLLGQLFILTM